MTNTANPPVDLKIIAILPNFQLSLTKNTAVKLVDLTFLYKNIFSSVVKLFAIGAGVWSSIPGPVKLAIKPQTLSTCLF